jgi:DNA gyrase subunit A
MLVRRSTLRATFGVNNLVLVPRQTDEGRIVEPRRLSIKEILEHFVLHRLEIIQRRSRYELERRKARLHIVKGLLIALDQIDEIIDAIRRSRTADTARRNLVRKFKLTEKQATAILDMQLRRLAAMERSKLKKEKKELEARIKYLEALLASEAKQLAVIVDETNEIKSKYSTSRRTTIVDAAPGENGAAMTSADLATPEEPQVVAVTTKGVLRRDASSYSYRVKTGASSRAVTAHRMHVRAEPTDKVLFVSSKGRAWVAPVGFVPEEASRTKIGLDRDEEIIHSELIDLDRSLLIGTSKGKIKRTALSDLEPDLPDGVWTPVIGLGKSDRAIFAGTCDEKGQVLIITGHRLLRTLAQDVSDQKTLTARGVAGIKPGKDTEVLGGAVIQDPTKYEVFLLDGKGYLRRVPLKQFSTQGRGGKGLKITDGTRSVVAAAAAKVNGSTKVDALAEDGKRQRIPVKSIPRARTRQSRGKRLVKIGDVSEIVLF